MSLVYPILGFTRRPTDNPLGHAYAGFAKGQKAKRRVAYCGVKLDDMPPGIMVPLGGPPVFNRDGSPVPLYHGGHARACKDCSEELLRRRKAKLAGLAQP